MYPFLSISLMKTDADTPRYDASALAVNRKATSLTHPALSHASGLVNTKAAAQCHARRPATGYHATCGARSCLIVDINVRDFVAKNFLPIFASSVECAQTSSLPLS